MCAGTGSTLRETDGQPGVGFHVKVIKLPNGTQITAEQLQELAQSKQGLAQLEQIIAEVYAPCTPLGDLVTCSLCW
jgi:hypothetical protein